MELPLRLYMLMQLPLCYSMLVEGGWVLGAFVEPAPRGLSFMDEQRWIKAQKNAARDREHGLSPQPVQHQRSAAARKSSSVQSR